MDILCQSALAKTKRSAAGGIWRIFAESLQQASQPFVMKAPSSLIIGEPKRSCRLGPEYSFYLGSSREAEAVVGQMIAVMPVTQHSGQKVTCASRSIQRQLKMQRF